MSNVVMVISIAQAVQSILESIKDGVVFYRQTVDFMDSMEIDSGLSGTQKKLAVMDKMKEILLGENEDWESWKKLLIVFIDKIKSTYNLFKIMFA